MPTGSYFFFLRVGFFVGRAVVGRAVVGRAVVGRAVVGRAVVGRAVVGAVVGRAVVGGLLTRTDEKFSKTALPIRSPIMSMDASSK